MPPSPADTPGLRTLAFISPTAEQIARPPARLARATILVIALFAVVMGVVLSTLPIDRVVVAQGRLVSLTPTILIQPLEAAIVRSFEVRLNQVVRQGDLIARLDPTFAGADLSTLRAQEASIAAEVARLEAEAQGQPFHGGTEAAAALQAAIFGQREAERHFRTESLRQRIRSLQEGIQRSEGELRQLRERAQIAGQIETMRRDLERVQVGSRLNSLLAADSRIEVQRAIVTAEGTIRAAQRDIAGTQADLDAYLGNWRAQVSQDLAARRRDLSDVREALSKAQLRHDLIEMRAPADAVVLEVGKTSVGAVLSAGEMLVTLVPLDSRLEVEAAVEPRDLGHITVGDRVALKFETFPFVRHGLGRGRVVSVSQDATQARGAQNAPMLYRARIVMEEAQLRNLPADSRFLPGMPVQADIIVGRRTPLRYFFERAMPSLVEGMREP